MREPGDQIETIRNTETLADLAAVVGADSEEEGYFRAKQIWESSIAERQAGESPPDGLPGTTVTVDGHSMHVHGVTHAGSTPERESLREYVTRFLDRGAVVYCEQGIRSMYFEEMAGVCEMDDYLWATAACEELDEASEFDAFYEGVESVSMDLGEFVTEFRERTFSMIDAGSAMYGEQFERTLGAIAADLFADHTDRAVGNSYEAFRLSQEASEDPSKLHALQQYYERTFLPQPLEREWLRRHDPELELFSHARNERMAEYVQYHNETVEEVHVIVGAAHQHGVAYYLDQFEEGDLDQTEFELY
ncbi:hypothetical protein [Halovenus sp. HT40]|uniref:hypothetical protein n=1 Tax=Halovenus sp. HT40 TaxID=3126691 RepID=UPI00300F314B